MNTAILLCAAMLAADNPAQVQAKVLYGTADEQQQRADIELWISQAVKKSGSPLAQPYTNWIPLTNEERELYTSMQGGRLIKANVSGKDEKFTVEISGYKIKPLQQTITLKPGERRVVKLTDYPAPNNVFIALEAPLSEKAKKRAEALKAEAKTFRLELNYAGEQDKPFYRMTVSVPVIDQLASDPFHRIVQVKEDEAIRIIDHLARDGFFDSAEDLLTPVISVFPPTMQGYTMKVLPYYEDLGWGLPMIHRLDALREVLPEKGKKDMDLLLGRLSGWRKKWEAEHPPFEAKVGREDSRVSFTKKSDKTIIDITSEFGIDHATIRRKSEEWPKTILVRLHLSGLESFKAGSGNVAVEWSVASTGDPAIRMSLVSGKRVAAIPKDSPYLAEVRIVGGNGAIPLKNGYFEVSLPAKLFERNPNEITLEWIDFYRR